MSVQDVVMDIEKGVDQILTVKTFRKSCHHEKKREKNQ